MTLGQLRFKGCNGHSKIIKIPGGEEINTPLLWVEDLKLVHIPQSKLERGETEEAYHRRLIESNSPSEATYFARSEDILGLYVGVQYYRAAAPEDTLDQRIPVGMPQVFGLNHKLQDPSAIQHLIQSWKPKDATNYIHLMDSRNRFTIVQYYR